MSSHGRKIGQAQARPWLSTAMAFGQQGGEAQLAEVRCLMQTVESIETAM